MLGSSSYKYKGDSKGSTLPKKPPKLISGCLIPLAIFLVIVLLAYYLGSET
jgi:hypothetical protein